MKPIPPSMNCQHQANSAYDKLAVISENMPKLLEVEQFIFELKQWLRAYIDKVKENISEENFAKITNNNTFTGINTFTNVHLHDGNIYWVDAAGNNLAWVAFDPANNILTLHVQDSELTLSPNIAMTVPTDADIPNSIVTYSFLNGLLQELENTLRVSTTNTITQGSTNLPTSDAVYQFVTNNQFQLTLEDTVIEDSSNGVKSSGIFTALKNLEDSINALRTQLEELSESRGDLFDTFGVEDGVWTYTDSTYGSTSVTLTAGHIYKVVECYLWTEGQSVRPVKISTADINKIDVVYIITQSFQIVKAIKPREDITISSSYGNHMVIREYTEFDVSDRSTEFNSGALGWGYTTE